MKIKRIYHQDKLIRDADGEVCEVLPGAVAGIKILQADKGVHHFSQSFIDGGVQEGWLELGKGKLTLTPIGNDPVVYRIVRTPGHYCCHCEQPIADAARLVKNRTKGQIHIHRSISGSRYSSIPYKK